MLITSNFWQALQLLWVLALFFVPAQAKAGAWVKEQNKFYSEFSWGSYEASDIFNTSGKRGAIQISPLPGAGFLTGIPASFVQNDVSVFLEYGLGWDFELMLNSAYLWSSQKTASETFSVSGIGDSQVGLKYKWFDRSQWVSSFETVLGIPTGDKNAVGKVTGKIDQPIPLGDGEWDVAFRAWLSRSFHPWPVYVSASYAYRVRTSSGGTQYGDDMPWSVDGGYTLALQNADADRAWLKDITFYAAVRGLIATKDFNLGAISATAATGTLPSQEFIDIQPGILFNFHKHFGLNTSFIYNLAGSNTGAGYRYRVGLTWAF